MVTATEAASFEALRMSLVSAITARIEGEGSQTTDIAGLNLYRRTAPTQCTSATYEPSLVLFLQGEKRINLGQRSFVCTDCTYLITSVDLPVVSQIVRATPEEPNLGLILKLEMPMIRELLAQEEFPIQSTPDDAIGMAVGTTSLELLSACARLVGLLNTPADIPFVGNLLKREIVYRLLRSPQGAHLRTIATLGEQTQRTAKAVEWLSRNYAKPLRVEDLAGIAHMGVSTLHRQFRALTAMTPVQYQKQLRLHIARQRMVHAGLDAASAAFEVGYESPSQFNREYRRFFGTPPMRDARIQKLNQTVEAQ